MPVNNDGSLKLLTDRRNHSINLKTVLVFFTLSMIFADNLSQTIITECDSGKQADIIFVLDASNSIWSPDFQRQLNFVEEIIKAFRIGPQHTQVALITYADYPIVQFQLDYYVTKSDVLTAIAQIRQNGGFHTRTSEALRYMRERCFAEWAGARENVTRLGVIITDGQSDDPELTTTEASLAKQAGIHMFAVGVGVNQVPDELNVIASIPTTYYTFMVENYEALTNIRNLLAIKACSVTDPPTTTTTPMTTTLTTTTQPSTTIFFKVTSIRSNVVMQRQTKSKRISTTANMSATKLSSNILSIPTMLANVKTDTSTESEAYNRRKEVQHRDDNDNLSITDTNEVIDSMEALHNQGIKVVIDNSNQTNGEIQSDWTYDDHLQKWILKKPRRDDVRQDSGFWSYNEAERLVWTPTEYYYQRKREHTDFLNYNKSEDSADTLGKVYDGDFVDFTDREGSEEYKKSKSKDLSKNNKHKNVNELTSKSSHAYYPECRTQTPLDIVFIIDSKIPTRSERKQMWKLVRDVLRRIDIIESQIRIQFVQSCTMFERSLALTDVTNQEAILHAIDEITTLPQSTAELFESMTSKFKPEMNGLSQKKKIAIYLTDRPSGDLERTVKAAQKAKNDHGIEIFAVAYGNILNHTELQAIVSFDVDQHLYQIKNHSKSRVAHKKIAKYLCKL